MKCGVRFCGGCNSRYVRGIAYKKIKDELEKEITFDYASENVEYDLILVIGGCPNCCASYSQFTTRLGIVKLYDIKDIDKTIKILRDYK